MCMLVYCLAILLGGNFHVDMGMTKLFIIIRLGHNIFSGP